MSDFSVTLNYDCNYGYLEYNSASKTAQVFLAVSEAREAVEKFLATPITLQIPQGETIRDFVTTTLKPLDNVEVLKLSLTRLWNATGVRVEWSMPPGMAEKITPTL